MKTTENQKGGTAAAKQRRGEAAGAGKGGKGKPGKGKPGKGKPGKGKGSVNHIVMSYDDYDEVCFQRKNPDFPIKNPDFLLRNPDFLLNNVDSIIKQDAYDEPLDDEGE